uniref:Glutaredoxin domain-containing protein n=1 Tax=viral metagenome TaxID=1070528 RepID=A0A6C0C792_9ZZZZ
MDIYISKKCPHCKKLLIVFYNNKYLIQYFNIIDVESIQIPNYITSVPTLAYNGELYFDERMYNLIDSVNQHHMKENGMVPNQQQQQQQQQQSNMQPPMGTKPQGDMMNGMRQPDLNMQHQQNNSQQGNPAKQIEKPPEEGEIMGICLGEDCLYENISDDTGNNNLMQGYCFLDEGYSSEKPTGPNNDSSTKGEKPSRFDNNAYEQMMKNRGGM